ncbi:MAG: hypothetical protein ACYCVD_05005 [Desulfitobacteriaceae bacterium]
MERMDSLWTQLFPDQPVPKQAVESFQDRIMAEIFSHPVNFAAEAQLALRRRWGLLFAGSWLGLGLVVLLLVFFQGSVIADLFTGMLSLFGRFLHSVGTALAGLLANSWPVAWGEFVWNKFIFIFTLRTPLSFLWQEYSWQLTGVVVISALLVGGMMGRPLWNVDDINTEQ